MGNYSWCYTNCCNCIYDGVSSAGQSNPEYGICNVLTQARSAFSTCSAKYGDCGENLSQFNYELSTWCVSTSTKTSTTSTSKPTTPTTIVTTTSTSKSSSTTSTTSSSQPTPTITSTKSSTTSTTSSSFTPTTTSNTFSSIITVPTSSITSSSTTSSSSSSSTSSKSTSTTTAPTIVISYVTPSVASATTTSTSSTHSAIPQYTAGGNLLVGYCATPYFTVIPGPTTDLFVGVVGCVGDKGDCCPFAVASTHANTATSTGPSFTTVTLGATTTSNSFGAINQNVAFPTALDAQAGVLDKCPGDYQLLGNQCCPSNYLLFSTMLGGQTPCYSTITPYLTPPPLVAATSTGVTAKPTQAVVNVVYAMAYPVKTATPSGGMPTAAKAGIGGGVGAVALIALLALGAFFWRKKSQKKRESTLFAQTSQGTPGQSTLNSGGFSGTPASRVSEMYQSPPPPQPAGLATNSNIMGYPPGYAPVVGQFDRDQGRRYNNVSPVERGMSVSPPDQQYQTYPPNTNPLRMSDQYNYPPQNQQQYSPNPGESGYFPPSQQPQYPTEPPPMSQQPTYPIPVSEIQAPARAQTIQRVPVPAPRPVSSSPEPVYRPRVLATVPPEGLYGDAPPSPPSTVSAGANGSGTGPGSGRGVSTASRLSGAATAYSGRELESGRFTPVDFGLPPGELDGAPSTVSSGTGPGSARPGMSGMSHNSWGPADDVYEVEGHGRR
ncbi:hypothetical protein BGZ60DRAFT_226620 [Tricladium varicosporioides]|nr:hypothetical protein BGZ60DRAFT_226620 [Hymenoscyphus varicosporioides]